MVHDDNQLKNVLTHPSIRMVESINEMGNRDNKRGSVYSRSDEERRGVLELAQGLFWSAVLLLYDRRNGARTGLRLGVFAPLDGLLEGTEAGMQRLARKGRSIDSGKGCGIPWVVSEVNG